MSRGCMCFGLVMCIMEICVGAGLLEKHPGSQGDSSLDQRQLVLGSRNSHYNLYSLVGCKQPKHALSLEFENGCSKWGVIKNYGD